MKAIESFYQLSNGIKIPKIGFGTWQIKPGKETFDAVSTALKVGYRHIDTAQGYYNEESVGEAIKASNISREDIFVTSKLESHIKTYEDTKLAFFETLKKLDMSYIDLFIIHAPWPWSEMGKNCDEGNVAAYKAMEELYEAGYCKAIGVSNFEVKHLKNILDNCKIVPHVNQIGYFIGIDQSETIDFCKLNNIFIEAYSPLGIGYLLSNKTINQIAKKYEVSPAQICIRYLLQKEVCPLPKSIHEDRMIQNTIVDFIISDEDMKILDQVKGDPRRWS